MEGEIEIAAFDFDGTMARGDALLAFLRHRFGPNWLFWTFLRGAPGVLGALALGDRGRVKEALLRAALAGTARTKLTAWAEEFARSNLLRRLSPAALAAIAAHRSAGRRVVIVSASPEFLLVPVARALQMEVVATRLEFLDDALTGKLDGRNCWGAEKLRRLQDHVGAPYRLVAAYGDSRGDRELLAAAQNAFFRCFPLGVST